MVLTSEATGLLCQVFGQAYGRIRAQFAEFGCSPDTWRRIVSLDPTITKLRKIVLGGIGQQIHRHNTGVSRVRFDRIDKKTPQSLVPESRIDNERSEKTRIADPLKPYHGADTTVLTLCQKEVSQLPGGEIIYRQIRVRQHLTQQLQLLSAAWFD
jgi:hypothetical protein